MELKFAATIDLKAEDVEKILTDAIKAQMKGYSVTAVSFQTEKQYDFRGSECGTKFTGAKVSVVPKDAEF